MNRDYDKNIAVDKIRTEFWDGTTLVKIIAQLQAMVSRHGGGAFLVPDTADEYEIWRPRTPTELEERRLENARNDALNKEHRREQWLELCKEFGPEAREALLKLASLELCAACVIEGQKDSCEVHSARRLAGKAADALGLDGKSLHKEAKKARGR